MSEQKLKVDEVAAVLGESRHIVRNWLRDFREWIPVERAGNGYNAFGPEAVEKMKLIRSLYRDRGFSTRQIEHYFASGEQVPSSVDLPKVDDIADLRSTVQQLAAAQEEHNRLARQIVEQLEIQNKRAEERDRKVMESLRESLEVKQLLLQASNDKSWWKFWK